MLELGDDTVVKLDEITCWESSEVVPLAPGWELLTRQKATFKVQMSVLMSRRKTVQSAEMNRKPIGVDPNTSIRPRTR